MKKERETRQGSLLGCLVFLLLFAAYGFFSGLLADYFFNQRFVAYLILAALSLALTGALLGLALRKKEEAALFEGTAPVVINIGDCSTPANIAAATR